LFRGGPRKIATPGAVNRSNHAGRHGNAGKGNMKKVIFALIIGIGVAAVAFGQTSDTVAIRVGKHAKAGRSGLTVRFIEVLEDSRCPAGVACVWAGNARVKIEVTNRGGGKQIIEANTGKGPKGDQFDGWAIDLVSLSPSPTKKGKPDTQRYSATFTVTRLQR
jgi:hypothetical protein